MVEAQKATAVPGHGATESLLSCRILPNPFSASAAIQAAPPEGSATEVAAIDVSCTRRRG